MKKLTFAAIAVATLIIGAPVVAQIVPGLGPAPTERGPAAVEADCVLDQTTLSTLLYAIDSAHAAQTGSTVGARFAVAELVDQEPASGPT